MRLRQVEELFQNMVSPVQSVAALRWPPAQHPSTSARRPVALLLKPAAITLRNANQERDILAQYETELEAINDKHEVRRLRSSPLRPCGPARAPCPFTPASSLPPSVALVSRHSPFSKPSATQKSKSRPRLIASGPSLTKRRKICRSRQSCWRRGWALTAPCASARGTCGACLTVPPPLPRQPFHARLCHRRFCTAAIGPVPAARRKRPGPARPQTIASPRSSSLWRCVRGGNPGGSRLCIVCLFLSLSLSLTPPTPPAIPPLASRTGRSTMTCSFLPTKNERARPAGATKRPLGARPAPLTAAVKVPPTTTTSVCILLPTRQAVRSIVCFSPPPCALWAFQYTIKAVNVQHTIKAVYVQYTIKAVYVPLTGDSIRDKPRAPFPVLRSQPHPLPSPTHPLKKDARSTQIYVGLFPLAKQRH